MKTNPVYLTDTYKKQIDAKILEVLENDSSSTKILLDKTILYPMGGGQATDQGVITKGSKHFDVYQVQIVDGEIFHFVKTTELKAGDNITVKLDWNRRYINMQKHSAGHIIDFAMHKLGYSPSTLQPIKADHNKKLFIEYKGTVDDTNQLLTDLEKLSNEIIKNNLQFSWEFVDFETLKSKAIYLQPNLPQNKPLRMLSLEGIGSVADGGTIVKTTSETNSIKITSIEKTNDSLKVHYKLKETKSSKPLKKEENKKVSTELSKEHANLLESVKNELQVANSKEELTNLWRKYLGKSGVVKDLMSKIKEVPKEQKKEFGQSLNILRNQIDNLINSAKEELIKNQSSEYLKVTQAKLDFNKPKIGHLHPITETINEMNNIFRRIGYSIYDGPEIETYEYNFKRLNVPEDHPALDLQDSIYIEEPNILLRTQTSSMESRALVELKPPFKIVMPGRTYRNEKVNKSNHFMFHQYQLVCVQEKVSLSELLSTIDYLFKSFMGKDVKTRFRNKYYPEVEPGVGPDMLCFNCKGEGCAICKKRGWLEMGGAGIIHPNVMKMAGLDTNKWQGFAFGMGLDRWAMAKHGITDIRTLLGGNLAYKPNVR